MKYALLILVLGLCIFIYSCGSDDDNAQLDTDIMLIEQYLEDNNLTAQRTESGLHYIITNEGDGNHPASNDAVTVMYVGQLLDGTIFDRTQAGQSRTFPLTNLIKGWQEGIPLLSKGGSGKFFLPSELGYGNRVNGQIPANSVLIFDISLVDF